MRRYLRDGVAATTLVALVAVLGAVPSPPMKGAFGYVGWTVKLGVVETTLYSEIFRYASDSSSCREARGGDLAQLFMDDMLERLEDLTFLSTAGLECGWDLGELEEERGHSLSLLRELGTTVREVSWRRYRRPGS